MTLRHEMQQRFDDECVETLFISEIVILDRGMCE